MLKTRSNTEKNTKKRETDILKKSHSFILCPLFSNSGVKKSSLSDFFGERSLKKNVNNNFDIFC